MFNQPSFKYALLVGDIVTLAVAFVVALFLADPDFSELIRQSPKYVATAIVTIIGMLPVFLFVFLINNLYKLQTLRSRYRHTTVVLKCVLVSILILLPFAIIFTWEFFSTHGRNAILYFFFFASVFTTLARLIIVKYFVHTLGRRGKKRKLLVVGGDRAAKKVAHAMEQDTHAAFEIVGFVDDYKVQGELIFDERENLGGLDDLGAIVTALSPDEILIAIDNAPYSRLVNIVDSALRTGLVVRVFSDRLQVIAEKLGAEQYAEGIQVVMLSQVQPRWLDRSLRRIIDVILSLTILIVLIPLLLVVVIGIKLSSPGPLIFRQSRIGYGGKSFDFYKFRSMHIGESAGHHQEFVEQFIKGEKAATMGEQEIQVFKIKDDPRIFPFGRFIRRTSLDEFPQLFNVLKGDMGLVGPRPCLPYEWNAYDSWHKDRLSVVPGCTGLWQVLGRSTVTFEDMVLMDLYYISNYSLVQDARILYKTIPAIFFAKGGY